MADAPSAWTQFFAELKRRRVVRVAAVYLAASFVIIQAAPSIFQALLLPDWAFRLLLVLLILGFVIAVPLAWAYDVGPGGIQRTPPAGQVAPGELARRSRVRWWPAVAGLALLAVAAGGWLALRRREPAANPRRVVVAAFENQTGDAALAPMSNMAADWITQGLSETGIVEVADAPTALTVARQAGLGTALTGADAVRRFSRETGAGLVVTGRYYRHADSLAFVAQVVDARSGRVVRAINPVTAPVATPVQGAEGLRQRLVSELAVLLDDRLTRFQALERQPPRYEAYREYMDGLASYIRGDSSAVDHFERAFALDSTFDRALLWAAECVFVMSTEAGLERYDSLIARVERRRARLTPGEQHQLDFVHALRAGDFRAAYEAARLRWEAAPGSEDALRELAFSAYRLHRHREASALFARLDPDRGLLRGNPVYWNYLCAIAHDRGDFAGQLRWAAEWARRQPNDLAPDFHRLLAFASLGRSEELRPLTARLADQLADDPSFPYVLAAHELAAHANQSDALALARLGLTRCEEGPSTPAQLRAGFALDCADLLGFLGRWREADSLIRGAGRLPSLRRDYLTAAGVAAARLGDRARALALSDSLSSMPVRTGADMYMLPTLEVRRAMIAGALGEREEALRRLRLWYAAGDYRPYFHHAAPALIPYFSDPRFRKLLQSAD